MNHKIPYEKRRVVYQAAIEKYGEEKGKAIKHAEFFEICEYGTVISKEELNEIFD